MHVQPVVNDRDVHSLSKDAVRPHARDVHRVLLHHRIDDVPLAGEERVRDRETTGNLRNEFRDGRDGGGDLRQCSGRARRVGAGENARAVEYGREGDELALGPFFEVLPLEGPHRMHAAGMQPGVRLLEKRVPLQDGVALGDELFVSQRTTDERPRGPRLDHAVRRAEQVVVRQLAHLLDQLGAQAARPLRRRLARARGQLEDVVDVAVVGPLRRLGGARGADDQREQEHDQSWGPLGHLAAGSGQTDGMRQRAMLQSSDSNYSSSTTLVFLAFFALGASSVTAAASDARRAFFSFLSRLRSSSSTSTTSTAVVSVSASASSALRFFFLSFLGDSIVASSTTADVDATGASSSIAVIVAAGWVGMIVAGTPSSWTE